MAKMLHLSPVTFTTLVNTNSGSSGIVSRVFWMASNIIPTCEKHFSIGPDRVDIFNQVTNLSIWMYYLPDPGTNQVSFVYMYKISYGMCAWIIGCQCFCRHRSTWYRQ